MRLKRSRAHEGKGLAHMAQPLGWCGKEVGARNKPGAWTWAGLPALSWAPRQLAKLEEELPIFPRSPEVAEASVVLQVWGKGLGD